MEQLINAHAMKDGQVWDATFQIVQALLIVTTEDFVIQHLNPLPVLTVRPNGWGQDVVIHVFMVNKYQWTAVTVFAYQVIQESDATANVRSTGKL